MALTIARKDGQPLRDGEVWVRDSKPLALVFDATDRPTTHEPIKGYYGMPSGLVRMAAFALTRIIYARGGP